MNPGTELEGKLLAASSHQGVSHLCSRALRTGPARKESLGNCDSLMEENQIRLWTVVPPWAFQNDGSPDSEGSTIAVLALP